MTVLGLDYSAGRPLGAAIAAAGYRFAVRYLENGLGSGRANLTAAEFTDLRSHGVDVALVWESQANRAAAGRAAGASDAGAAITAARAVGADGWPVFFAVDYDIPDYSPAATSPLAKLGPVGEYFAGVRSVLPLERVGVYGGYWPVRRTLDAGLASLAWQTVAWSGGQQDPRIHLYQRAGYVTIGGVECDVNEQRQTYFGQGPASTPAPAQTSEDDDMLHFIADLSTPLGNGQTGYSRVAMLRPNGTITGVSWPEAASKDKQYNGDGTGSILGVAKGEFDDIEADSNDIKAANKALAKLTSVGGGTQVSIPMPSFDLTITGTATPKGN